MLISTEDSLRIEGLILHTLKPHIYRGKDSSGKYRWYAASSVRVLRYYYVYKQGHWEDTRKLGLAMWNDSFAGVFVKILNGEIKS